MSTEPPDDLKRLGERIDEIGRKRVDASPKSDQGMQATAAWIAVRIVAEIVAALIMGGCLGWCVDWAFDHWSPWHTRPWGVIVFLVLGIVAGVKNVMSTAKEINAELAKKNLEK